MYTPPQVYTVYRVGKIIRIHFRLLHVINECIRYQILQFLVHIICIAWVENSTVWHNFTPLSQRVTVGHTPLPLSVWRNFWMAPDWLIDWLIVQVIPMLPRLLCEELCSLNSNEDRLTFSVIWTITSAGEVVTFYHDVICKCKCT